MDVSAACADNTVTPNFIATGITLGHNLIAPVGGVAGTLGNGSLDIVDADNGSATINNQSIDEVGVFEVTAALDTYLGITAAAGTHLIEGISSNIGRFIPARVAVNGNIPAFDNGCTAGALPYTYLGQDFGFITNPVITVAAQNTAGNFTRNYGGAFWKLDPALANRSYTNNVAALPGFSRTTDGGDAALIGDNFDATPPTLTIAGDRFTYPRTAAPVSARSADVDLAITAADLTDSDGVCFDPANAVCNSGGPGTATGLTISNITGSNLRYGIGIATDVLQPNTTVDPLNPTTAILPITAQYVNAGGTTVTNVDDMCSPITYTKIDTGISTTVAPANPFTLNSGSGNLTVTLTADTGGDIGGYSVFTLTWPAWLPGPANATAIFGAVPSDNNYLYWNESR
jgi:MSHA biogenesis protein MshQ